MAAMDGPGGPFTAAVSGPGPSMAAVIAGVDPGGSLGSEDPHHHHAAQDPQALFSTKPHAADLETPLSWICP